MARLNSDPMIIAKRSRCQVPTPVELALADFLPPSFIHTGQDASRRIAGRFLDYQNPERRLGIEMDGHWSHYTPEGIRSTEQRDRLLKTVGWRVLHVRPEELRDRASLVERIRLFLS